MTDSRRDFLVGGAALAVAGALGALGGGQTEAAETRPASEAAQTDFRNVTYTLRPIGRVRNRKGKPVQLEIFEKYVPGLLRLELCKQVMVVWWFHKNDTPEKRSILKVHPRGNPDNPLTGVFATHSPFRPNLIALTVCKILSVKDGLVTIDSIDAFDDTPIIDLKSV
jgi:tRNA-Thr(GGU) m(6)t(6)A37 methyltransferase TsaA